MPLNARDPSVAVFVRGLTNLKSLLTKGEAHAVANAIDPAELLYAQLIHDMNGLATQVHWAAEGPKLAVARLLGTAATPLADDAKSFADLYTRLDTTIAYLESQSPEHLEAGLDRTIELTHRGRSTTFGGAQFLLQFAIPSFFFHMTTAYGILRQKGVEISKGDFIGPVFD